MSYPAPGTVPHFAPVSVPTLQPQIAEPIPGAPSPGVIDPGRGWNSPEPGTVIPTPTVVPARPLTFEERQKLLEPVPDIAVAGQPYPKVELQDESFGTAQVLDRPADITPRPDSTASRKKTSPAPAAKAAAPSEPSEPEASISAQTHRKARTGAGARFSGDARWVFLLSAWGTLFTALCAVALSWQGLVAASAWLLLEGPATYLLPLVIDVPIVVLTIGQFPRRARGESTLPLAIPVYTLAAISAAANALHIITDTPTGPDGLPYTAYLGAILAALAPIIALVTTEVLGLMVTRPTKAQRAHAARLQAIRDRAELAEATAAAKATPAKKPAARKKAT